VGGLPEVMKLALIEPLRELFKDEGRQVGFELGLSRELVMRQPFPGPGLAVRILGEITPKRLEILRSADAILIEEIRRADLYEKVWQSFAVLLPVKTVGVMGDERTYENVIALRIVDSRDAMTRTGPGCLRDPGPGLQPDHQRGARREPRGLRHLLQTPQHHRVGVTLPGIPLFTMNDPPRAAGHPQFLPSRHSVLDTESSQVFWVPAFAGLTDQRQATGIHQIGFKSVR